MGEKPQKQLHDMAFLLSNKSRKRQIRGTRISNLADRPLSNVSLSANICSTENPLNKQRNTKLLTISAPVDALLLPTSSHFRVGETSLTTTISLRCLSPLTLLKKN